MSKRQEAVGDFMLIALVVGTRPEAIKLAPVYLDLASREGCTPVMINTRQHPTAVQEVFDFFGITPEIELDVMVPGQSLASLTARLMTQLGDTFAELKPNMVVVQGDTTSAFCGALAAFYQDVRIAHVEAGLRTDSMFRPFPEEMNRRLISQMTWLHYAPTQRAAEVLLGEGIPAARVAMVGNTVVDALEYMKSQLDEQSTEQRSILVTMHRRENWGEGIKAMCEAIRRIVDRDQSVLVKFATHMNPEVQSLVRTQLDGVERVEVLKPVGYKDFLGLMRDASVIISDSGGVAEEAPSFGVPVLITRTETERLEALEAGSALLVALDVELLVEKTLEMLELGSRYKGDNPFGDGRAAHYIGESLVNYVRNNYEGE